MIHPSALASDRDLSLSWLVRREYSAGSLTRAPVRRFRPNGSPSFPMKDTFEPRKVANQPSIVTVSIELRFTVVAFNIGAPLGACERIGVFWNV